MQNMLNVATGCDSSQASFKFVNALKNVEKSATFAMNMGKRLVNTLFPSYVSVKAPWISNGKSLFIQGHPIKLRDERRQNSSIDVRKAIVASASARSLVAVRNSSEAATDIMERAALEHAFGDAVFIDSKSPSTRFEGDGVCQDLEISALNRHPDVTALASQDTAEFNLQVYAIRKSNSIGKRKIVGDLTSSIQSCMIRRCKMRKLNAGEGKGLSVLVSNLQYQNTGRKRLSSSNRIALQARKRTSIPSTGIYCSEVNDLRKSLLAKDKPQTTSNQKKRFVVMDWGKVEHRLLTIEEETKLAASAKPYKQLQMIRQELLKKLVGKDPSDDEWAKAANLSLAALLEKLQTASAARNKLVHHNRRLVLFHARKYEKGKLALSLHDMCQAGVKGLLDAVDHFDLQKGCRFSTYAIFWVRTAIVRAVSNFGNSSSEPYNFAMHKLEIRNASMDLLFELQRPPTDEEIMERLGYKATRYKTILRSETRATSLNISPNDFIGERISNLADPNIGRSQEMKYLGETVAHVLNCLTPQEKIVLIERYGLGGSRQLSLREVGVKLNLSQETVRRYEIRGLLQLKHLTHKK